MFYSVYTFLHSRLPAFFNTNKARSFTTQAIPWYRVLYELRCNLMVRVAAAFSLIVEKKVVGNYQTPNKLIRVIE